MTQIQSERKTGAREVRSAFISDPCLLVSDLLHPCILLSILFESNRESSSRSTRPPDRPAAGGGRRRRGDVRKQWLTSKTAKRIKPGMRIAVGCGSRGIDELPHDRESDRRGAEGARREALRGRRDGLARRRDVRRPARTARQLRHRRSPPRRAGRHRHGRGRPSARTPGASRSGGTRTRSPPMAS